MKKTTMLMLWGILYAAVVYSVFGEYAKYCSNRNVQGFFVTVLFGTGKFLFDMNIFFTSLLFVLRKPFFSPMFVIRYKNHLTEYLVMRGLKISLGFTIYSVILYAGIPILMDWQISSVSNLLYSSVKLMIFVFYMHMTYIILFILSNRQVFALVGVFLNNIVMLITSISLNHRFAFLKNLGVLMIYCCLMSIMGILVLVRQSKNREYLNEI